VGLEKEKEIKLANMIALFFNRSTDADISLLSLTKNID